MSHEEDERNISGPLEEALADRGLGHVRVYAAVLGSSHPDVIPPRYVMVAPDVAESDLSLQRLAEINRELVRACSARSLLKDQGGLEILSRVVRNGIAVRIMRLTIIMPGVQAAENMTADDLRKAEPFPHVSCLIYMKMLLEPGTSRPG